MRIIRTSYCLRLENKDKLYSYFYLSHILYNSNSLAVLEKVVYFSEIIKHILNENITNLGHRAIPGRNS